MYVFFTRPASWSSPLVPWVHRHRRHLRIRLRLHQRWYSVPVPVGNNYRASRGIEDLQLHKHVRRLHEQRMSLISQGSWFLPLSKADFSVHTFLPRLKESTHASLCRSMLEQRQNSVSSAIWAPTMASVSLWEIHCSSVHPPLQTCMSSPNLVWVHHISYNNILWANWGENLTKVIMLGNSVSLFSDPKNQVFKNPQCNAISPLVPYLTEVWPKKWPVIFIDLHFIRLWQNKEFHIRWYRTSLSQFCSHLLNRGHERTCRWEWTVGRPPLRGGRSQHNHLWGFEQAYKRTWRISQFRWWWVWWLHVGGVEQYVWRVHQAQGRCLYLPLSTFILN